VNFRINVLAITQFQRTLQRIFLVYPKCFYFLYYTTVRNVRSRKKTIIALQQKWPYREMESKMIQIKESQARYLPEPET